MHINICISLLAHLKKMARPTNLPFLPLILFPLFYISASAAAATTTAATSASTNFIKKSCKATEYPAICVQTLSVYASAIQQSPRQLAQTALSVSLARAEYMKSFVNKLSRFNGLQPREYGAIKDCLDEIGDSVDQISQSARELKSMKNKGKGKGKGEDFVWHMSNMETWVSAALTDENSCLDGFEGKGLNTRIKASIRRHVTDVAQVTSNALALINQFADKN